MGGRFALREIGCAAFSSVPPGKTLRVQVERNQEHLELDIPAKLRSPALPFPALLHPYLSIWLPARLRYY